MIKRSAKLHKKSKLFVVLCAVLAFLSFGSANLIESDSAFALSQVEVNFIDDDFPAIYKVTPDFGPSSGGTTVLIEGANFDETSVATFDSLPCTDLIFISEQKLQCVTPAHPVGPVDVAVTTQHATAILRDGFTYKDPEKPLPQPVDPIQDIIINVPLTGWLTETLGANAPIIFYCCIAIVLLCGIILLIVCHRKENTSSQPARKNSKKPSSKK